MATDHRGSIKNQTKNASSQLTPIFLGSWLLDRESEINYLNINRLITPICLDSWFKTFVCLIFLNHTNNFLKFHP